MTHTEYNAMGRTLAEKHIEILHTDTEMHFVRLTKSMAPFEGLLIEELINSLRSKAKFPLLLWESYDGEYQNTGADHIWKLFHGGFILLDKAKNDDFDQQEEVMDRMERIGEELIGYIKNDLRQLSPTNNFKSYAVRLEDFSSEKVGQICDGLFGCRFNMLFKKAANHNLKFKEEKFS